jgi:hypothetical protein
MPEDLRQRLRRLGVVRGVRELAAQERRPRRAIEDVVSGRFHTTSRGRCFVVEARYPQAHRHGALSLADFLALPPRALAQLGQEDALAEVPAHGACFIDTETTGLSGGTGTMAFVVGLGFFEDDTFRVDQYFLRDPGDEPAMVETLEEQLRDFEFLVSFNGRAFDVPILENRFILARTPPPTTAMPHLDLLPPARRLWSHGLPSCRLGTLETEILDVRREQADVPSGVIPFLYRDYLRTGDAREMKRILYHNLIDILSLVTLAVRLSRPLVEPQEAAGPVSGVELYGLGRWQTREGAVQEAERAYYCALESDIDPALRARTLWDLGLLLRRADRRDEAFAYWQQLALEQPDDLRPYVELAKYFEWHVERPALAAAWTRAALARADAMAGDPRRVTVEELRHRLARLERKLSDKGNSAVG